MTSTNEDATDYSDDSNDVLDQGYDTAELEDGGIDTVALHRVPVAQARALPFEAAAIDEPRVAAAVALLDSLDGLPPGEQVWVFEDIHRRMQEALTQADDLTSSP